jgi:beta-1,2-mannobiose phosphorylase / 1,2-beta-oligomannan phosphorylase
MRLLLFVVVIPAILVSSGNAQLSWFKSTANPVVQPSGDVEAFDQYYTLNPVVIKEDRYRMWYTGFNEVRSVFSIGYAESDDGITWARRSPVPVVDVIEGSRYEGSYLRSSCVVKTDSGYRMYYQAITNNVGVICTAFSRDGFAWQHDTLKYMLPGASEAWDGISIGVPYVICFGANDYRMWYAGSGLAGTVSIGYATSRDGVSWTRYSQNPVLKANPLQRWEGTHVSTPRVIFREGAYHMFYVGVNEAGAQSIGYATSQDGVTWTRRSSSPILAPEYNSLWEWSTLGDHSVIFDNNYYRLWYCARGTYWRIGYAISEAKPLGVGQNHVVALQCRVDAFPNPFNPTTAIRFQVPGSGHVTLRVCDMLGREVAELVNEMKTPGEYTVSFDGVGLSSGMYICRMQAGAFVDVKKLALLR